MSIKANIDMDIQGNITVNMSGGFDYESSVPLRDELMELSVKNPHCDLIIDMREVDFVGSSGIGKFVETLCILNGDTGKNRVRLKNVKSEFQKVFRLYAKDELELLISEFESDDTFYIGRPIPEV